MRSGTDHSLTLVLRLAAATRFPSLRQIEAKIGLMIHPQTQRRLVLPFETEASASGNAKLRCQRFTELIFGSPLSAPSLHSPHPFS